MLLTEVFVPVGDRESHADREFAAPPWLYRVERRDRRSLPLPVAPTSWPRHRRRAAEAMGDAYELSVHVDGVPDELRQGVCDASNRLILDAPTGDVEFEPESMTVEDYQTMLDHQRDTGRTSSRPSPCTATPVSSPPTPTSSVPSGDPNVVFQWGTLVLPEHRGHRLGMAVKVANLEELATLRARAAFGPDDERRAEPVDGPDQQGPGLRDHRRGADDEEGLLRPVQREGWSRDGGRGRHTVRAC